MKKAVVIILILSLFCFLFACQNKEEQPPVEEYASASVRTLSMPANGLGEMVASINVTTDRTETDDFDEENTLSSAPYYIELSDNATVCKDEQGETAPETTVSVAGNVVVIKKIGTYVVTGKLTKGRIVLNSEDRIQLIFRGATVTSKGTPALETYGSGKKILTLASGADNYLCEEESDPSSDDRFAFMARSALLINGTGRLELSCQYGGIMAPSLRLVDATIDVSAKERAIESGSYINVSGAAIAASSDEEIIYAIEELVAKESRFNLEGGKLKAKDVILESATVRLKGTDGLVADRFLSARDCAINISVDWDGLVCLGEKGKGGIIRLANCTTVISDGDNGIQAGYLTFSSGTLLCYGMGSQIALSGGMECSPAIKEVLLLEPIGEEIAVEVGEVSTVFSRPWRTFVYAGKSGDGYLHVGGEKYAVLW